jgi:hypothetical protein
MKFENSNKLRLINWHSCKFAGKSIEDMRLLENPRVQTRVRINEKTLIFKFRQDFRTAAGRRGTYFIRIHRYTVLRFILYYTEPT